MRKAKRKKRQEDSGPAHSCCPPGVLAGPLSEPEKEVRFWPFPNSEIEKRVAFMLLDGLGPRQIAEELNVPYGEFLKWYTNRGVQGYLMAKRNNEAEKRRRDAEENIG